MSSPQQIASAQGNLIADGTNYKLRMVGPWQLLFGGSKVVTALDLRAVESVNLTTKVMFRTAAVDTNDPAAAGWLADDGPTSTNTDGITVFTLDTSTGYDEMMWVQAAVFTKSISGAYNQDARLWTAVQGAGWSVARQRVNVERSTSDQIIPIGTPFSASGVKALLFGVVYTGLDGTNGVTVTPIYRTFDGGDPSRPNAWIEGTAENEVDDDSRFAYRITATTTDKMLIQAGIRYTSDPTSGQLDIMVAATK